MCVELIDSKQVTKKKDTTGGISLENPEELAMEEGLLSAEPVVIKEELR